MPVVPEINTVVFDCADAGSLSRFWAALLDVEERMSYPGFIWLQPQREGGFSIAFQQVDDPTPGKNKLHLDTYHTDLGAMTDRVTGLGGSVVDDHAVGGFTWRVYADPEGNQFCVGHPS